MDLFDSSNSAPGNAAAECYIDRISGLNFCIDAGVGGASVKRNTLCAGDE